MKFRILEPNEVIVDTDKFIDNHSLRYVHTNLVGSAAGNCSDSILRKVDELSGHGSNIFNYKTNKTLGKVRKALERLDLGVIANYENGIWVFNHVHKVDGNYADAVIDIIKGLMEVKGVD